MKIVDLAEHAQVTRLYPAVVARGGRGRHAADSESGHRRRQHQPASALLVLPQRGVRLLQEGRLALLRGRRREPVPRDLRQQRTEPHRPPVEPGGALRRLRREVPRPRTERRARGGGGRLLHDADDANVLKENVLEDEELLTHVILPAPGDVKTRALRSALQAVARLAAGVHDRRADDEREHDQVGARRARRRRAGAVAIEAGGRGAGRQAAERADRRARPARRPSATRSR